ncbi:MAG TPA: hypothetical protein PLI22_06020 [Caldisericia bacterium]|mgnify:CR=1 FL=1|jgi:hypothetical protein|nr:hypothetical protein [Caldisericia bacterium]
MDLRKVEVLKDDKWEICKMKDLKVNDTFRMYEAPEHKELVSINEKTEFKVIQEPYLNEDNIWAVEIED